MIAKRFMSGSNIFKLIFLIICSIFVIFPLYWMLSTSFKNLGDVLSMPPQLWPIRPTLENFKRVLFAYPGQRVFFMTFFKNSLIVGSGTVIFSTSLAALSAYVFSRYRFVGRKVILNAVLIFQMFPLVLLLISFYAMFSKLGLLNTHIGLIIAHTSFALPLCTWMLKGFFDKIPKSIEEAALIDGCSQLQIVTKIIFPLALPGIFSVAVFAFLTSWDEYLFALTLIATDEVRTLPPGMVLTFVGQFEIRWGDMMAASVVVTIPIAIIFLISQRLLIEGLTSGAVKE